MENRITHQKTAVAILAAASAAFLVLGRQGASHGQQDVGGRIYWTEARGLGWIQRSNLDGSKVEGLITTELQSDPISLIALGGNQIFWTERNRETGKNTIRRAFGNGAEVETLFTGETLISAMAVDWFGGKVYWTDWDMGTIRRSDLDGSNVETLVTGVANPTGIALDASVFAVEGFMDEVPATMMYWTEQKTGTIRRSDLDGSNIETLVTGIGNPMGIALAGLFQDAHFRVEQQMYWADRDTGTIQRADLDGSNVETIVAAEDSIVAFALDWLQGLIYWTEWNSDSEIGTLRSAYVNGYEVEGFTETETEKSVIAVDSFRGTLYWLERSSNTIQRDREGSIPLGMEGPGSIALDIAGGMMYWVDKRTGSIRRANLDGIDVEDLVTGMEDAKDIALDVVAGKMYWAEQGIGAIRRADLNGTDVETALAGIENPDGVALDIPGGKVYWTSQGVSRFLDSGIIQRSNLDGSNVETLVAGLRDPVGIALDHVAGKMYLSVRSGSGNGRIYRANLDGSNGGFLVPRSNGPVEIALDIAEGRMYWSEKGAGVIRRSDFDGANVEEVVTGLVRPVGIALDVSPPASSTQTGPVSRTAVNAAVEGGEVASLIIEFVRAGSTAQADYAWSTVTDEAGRFALDIYIRDPAGVSGFYDARARNEEGELVGTWNDILLNDGQRQILELTLGDGVKVVAIERLGEPNPDPCSNGIAVPHPRINRDLVEDCRALLAFRDSWDQWDWNPRWNAATLIEYWTGVEVRNSRVRGVAISDMEIHFPTPTISGPFSSELSRLTALEVISLPANRLRGPIPPELGQLTQLRRVNLIYNDLSGPIPPELGQLTQLQVLDLRNNQLTGPIPSELGQLTQLQVLDLRNNQLTGPIPSELGRLTQLDRVYLDNNQFTCVPETLSKWAEDLPICQSVDLDPSEADFDRDGAVGFGDFFLFADAFGSSDPRFDLDGSGSVDFGDFFLLADHFGQPARGKLLALAREMIGLPDGPQLRNAPNPFNSRTVLSWFLLSPGPVRLEIYNTLGQRVRTLVDEVQAPGRHRVYWDALGQRGAPVAAGVYLSRLQYPGGVRTQRLLFLK